MFGYIENSTEDMEAFMYNEGEGKGGGNNVVSLIHQKLENKGVFEDTKEKEPGKYLTLGFDKCGGHNKNCIVCGTYYILSRKSYTKL